MATTNGLDPQAKTLKLENTEKRDTLIAIEKKYQKSWQDGGVFNATPPPSSDTRGLSPEEIRKKHPKYYAIFAYPYMNGTLHAGHSFTISKVEFTSGFARMEGKRVLFPVGYHCTGMPIKACADKLTDDVRKFGQNFEKYDEEEEGSGLPDGQPPAPTPAQTKEDITKFTSKKSKANAKTTKMKYQFQIMRALGIPNEEIHKFADAHYWLKYFPPICQQDLNNIGARIDWRRKFVTTDANPYYDAFVRWQMNRLHELNKVQYGVRYTIYSPKDGQPCMDHDRTEGEGVAPQDYTALKLKVQEWAPKAQEKIKGKIPETANVYFVPATLRPETMYGQTCCFVGPKITYGLFKVSENDYYFVTKRAAWNMAFQGTFFNSDKFPKDISELPLIVEMVGSDVVGTLVKAPLSIHTSGIRVLPMESVLATKGTGVVTSVPSDSPDDYATVMDLAKKAEYYGIQKEWAQLEILPVIQTPSYGNITAKFLVEKMKINSPKDAKQLAEAKDLAYKEGYYKGTMLVGDYKGQSVESAKPKVKEALIKAGEAFEYAEPNGLVISRSADECVTAYLGQWFLNYGENDPHWRNTVLDHVKTGLETYSGETQNGFEKNLDWLNRWACARTYGLGSKLPWDPKFLVESLSDSTIYMAYYTISYLLHSDLFGKEPGELSIKPSQMTDEVWDYIFCRTTLTSELSSSSGISKEDLERMRAEFEYWYPLDMNSSGKDLIPNHLTFFLYIHCALFPPEYWPRSVRANGHLLLNGDKMSKSTGNFLTLSDAVKKYGADACRIALADADNPPHVHPQRMVRGSPLPPGLPPIANAANTNLRPADAPSDTNFWDLLFTNDLRHLVHESHTHYSGLNFKAALKSCLYDFTSARDFYREATTAAGIGMHAGLVRKYIELQALVLTPIAPHWCDHIWQSVLRHGTTIQNALWPTATPLPNPSLSAAREYVRATSSSITSAEAAQQKRQAKGKTTSFNPKSPKKLTIYYAAAYPAWQDEYIDLVSKNFNTLTLSVDDKTVGETLKKKGGKEMKRAMPFVQGLKKRLYAGEDAASVFERKLPFTEVKVLGQMVKGLKRTTGCKVIEVVEVEEGGGAVEVGGAKGGGAEGGQEKKGKVVAGDGEGEVRSGLPALAGNAVPGSPGFNFENVG
ncbi:MAG: cytosolic leucyl tRNA synthetase [Ramalina farinacea]|uniref:leucine--tRNA ligase n=1 Tax=Ramalina farinacea TaxID=258253 RepID=A0AA43QUN4_9LECA|nr:cytosolic leucyl tRNA synthetase [Ramalina farinacea]